MFCVVMLSTGRDNWCTELGLSLEDVPVEEYRCYQGMHSFMACIKSITVSPATISLYVGVYTCFRFE